MRDIANLIRLLKTYKGLGEFQRLEIYGDCSMKAVYWGGILNLDAEGKIVR